MRLPRSSVVLTLLVAIDAATKYLAYLVLPTARAVVDSAVFRLAVVLNYPGDGFAGGVLLDRSAEQRAFAGYVAWGAVVVAMLMLRGRSFRRGTKVAVCMAVFVVADIVAAVLAPSAFHPWLLEVVGGLVILAFWVIAWVSAKSRLLNVGLSLQVAAGIGNTLLPIVLPPYAVIDFLNFRPLGVAYYNLADLYVVVGFAIMAVLMIRSMVLETRARRVQGHPASAVA